MSADITSKRRPSGVDGIVIVDGPKPWTKGKYFLAHDSSNLVLGHYAFKRIDAAKAAAAEIADLADWTRDSKALVGDVPALTESMRRVHRAWLKQRPS